MDLGQDWFCISKSEFSVNALVNNIYFCFCGRFNGVIYFTCVY